MLERKQGSLRRVNAISPLDDNGALIEELLESQLGELGPVLHSVKVDMRDLHAPRIDAHQLKGWACDMSRRRNTPREPADESRLTSTQVAFEQNQVALHQPRPKLLTHRFGLRRSVGD